MLTLDRRLLKAARTAGVDALENTYSQARQSFAAVLEEARRRGRVAIRRRDGQTLILRPETMKDSPLEVPGLDLNLSHTKS